MSQTSVFPTVDPEESEISLLDLLLTVVQNLRLLVLGPLVAGGLALGVAFLMPATYESVAVQSGDAKLVAMYNSAQVRDAIIKQTGYAQEGEGVDSSRKRLEKDLKVSLNAKDKTVTVLALAHTPLQAQKLAQAALEQAAVLNQMRLQDLQRLKAQFDLATSRERDYTTAAQRVAQQIINSPAANQAALAQSQSQLLEAARAAQGTTASLAAAIAQAENFELLQTPTLPSNKSGPKRGLIAILATLAAGFALLLFVFVRQALRNGAQDGETAQKLASIQTSWRKALGKA